MVKDYDITGYVDSSNGIIICIGCYNDLSEQDKLNFDAPIFLSDSFDTQPCCVECGDEIEVNLIDME